jgi:hypothetical protein
MKTALTELVKPNRVGWECLRHKDGWFVGTKEGITCYGEHMLARAALTIVWQRDGGRAINFRIVTLTDADVVNAGEYTPEHSAVHAMYRYEGLARKGLA